MPYVYMDELPDGMEEATVYSEEDYNGVTAQLEQAQTENTELATERDNLARELDAAKTKYSLQRSKGLGENEAEMMWLTTMNPETRRLIRVTPADVEETARMFDLLLGDNLQGRKDYIAENGSMYLELADIS